MSNILNKNELNMKINYVVFVIMLSGICGGELEKNFYSTTCPDAENVVQNITWGHVATNSDLPAKLLRMHFHDCFVRGCDGSVLIDSTANNSAERDAVPNLSLSGFDVIEEIKTQLETACPGIVSCADILTLAARDSVSFQFQTPLWEVLTGRRDGNISLASEALVNLPSPFSNFSILEQDFKNKNLTVHDLVVLSGGHTLGRASCATFSSRLYNFTGIGDQDPALDPTYATSLKDSCPPDDVTTRVELDPGSSLIFDTSYYNILQRRFGLLVSDATLLTNENAAQLVQELTDSDTFFTEFALSMVKMGAIEVLTGTQGEIRNKCNVINARSLHSAI